MVTAEKKGVMETFEWVYKNRHKYAKDLEKRPDKKLFGYFCTYMPEEIMYAAGIIPLSVMVAMSLRTLRRETFTACTILSAVTVWRRAWLEDMIIWMVLQ